MKKNLHGNRYHAVAADGAVDWDHPLNRGRVAWWLTPPGIAAGGGNVLDLCGSTNGTLTSTSPTNQIWTPSTNGTGMAGGSFSGGGENIALNNASATSKSKPALPLTVAAWVNVVDLLGYYGILSSNNTGAAYAGYDFGMDQTTGAIELAYSDNTSSTSGGRRTKTSTTGLTAGKWIRVVGVIRAATDMTIWMNGVDAGGTYDGTASGTIVYTAAAGNIGGASTYGFSAMKGQIFDVSVSNRDWTASDVLLDLALSSQGYQTTDSPLRWFSTRTWSVPAAGGVTVIPGVATLTLTKFAPTVLAPRVVVPATKALALSAFAPTVLTPRVALPGKLSLTLSAFAPTVLAPRAVAPGKLSLTLTTYAPSVIAPGVVSPGTAALTLSTFAPSVLAPRTVTPSTGSLSLASFAPTVLTPRVVSPAAVALILSAFPPTVTASGGAVVPAASDVRFGVSYDANNLPAAGDVRFGVTYG